MDFISADLTMLNLAEFMREALIEAEMAGQAGDLPIGAVVAIEHEIISRGRACRQRFRASIRTPRSSWGHITPRRNTAHSRPANGLGQNPYSPGPSESVASRYRLFRVAHSSSTATRFPRNEARVWRHSMGRRKRTSLDSPPTGISCWSRESESPFPVSWGWKVGQTGRVKQ